MSEPHLQDLPEWVKSFGLPPEAAQAIDRYWKPVWEKVRLLPRHHAPGEELELEAVAEERPGPEWQARYEAMWPAYRTWYLQEGDAQRPGYRECRDALARHMPELVPTYERLVELAGGGDFAARLLSLWRPPGFIVGCSQAVWTRDQPLLVRNYDYPASRLEGIVYLTRWGERRVLGMSDCLWGLLDGVNDAGLAVSLTFGGRPDVGEGFAISLVMRYLLETCDTVADARAVLERVPVHAPQNLSLLDRTGTHVTAYVGPDRPVRFVDTPVTTNHQGTVEWPEYARAIRTEERERCLLDLVDDEEITREGLVQRFLEPPLHNRQYAEGFGTIYTAAYDPVAASVQYRWPDHEPWELSLDAFSPGSRTVKLLSS